MYVSMCVCVYVCVYICVYVCCGGMYAYVDVCVSVCLSTYLSFRLHSQAMGVAHFLVPVMERPDAQRKDGWGFGTPLQREQYRLCPALKELNLDLSSSGVLEITRDDLLAAELAKSGIILLADRSSGTRKSHQVSQLPGLFLSWKMGPLGAPPEHFHWFLIVERGCAAQIFSGDSHALWADEEGYVQAKTSIAKKEDFP